MSESHALKQYSVGEFAKLTGVTERTLRFYDRKGLLAASGRNAQGHRYYTDDDLIRLQHILTLKYLDFPLDEISRYMQGTRSLYDALEQQYGMLERKKQQLERAMYAMNRMMKVLDGAERIHNSLLLMFIHGIQQEEKQRSYLAGQMPEPLIQAIYMDNLEDAERLERERTMMSSLLDLLELCRKGKAPGDPETVACSNRFIEVVQESLGDALSSLSEQEKQWLETLGESEDALDRQLFPLWLSKEEEIFLREAFEHSDKWSQLMGGDQDGS